MIIRNHALGNGTLGLHRTSAGGYYISSHDDDEPNIHVIGYLRRDMTQAERAFDRAIQKMNAIVAAHRESAA